MSQYIYPAGIKAKPLPNALSGIFDSLTDIGGKIVGFYGAGQQAQGANQVLNAQNQALMANSGGISTTTILLLGGLGIGAILLLKKKKSQ